MSARTTNALIERADRTAEAAYVLLRTTRLRERWEARGAEVHLVGSLATGLLLKHLDIDLHVYTPTLDPADGFAIAASLAPCRLEYRDLSDTSERCLEWHLWLRDAADRKWQVDVIQMSPDSPYKGYFEHRTERIRAALTPETRNVILAIKDNIPLGTRIPGILIYMAVLHDGIRTPADFQVWLRDHPLDGILDWCPEEIE